MSDLFEYVSGWLRWVVKDHSIELAYGLAGIVFATIRAAGKTVVSGTTGLKFSCGRATRELEPGFHLLFPFLQIVRTLPTRSRTLDLSTQQVTTLDGLVYMVDANLVYRVVDVRRALIEIDELERGMLQMLGLGVQEVLRSRDRAQMRVSGELDHLLEENLRRRLGAWGVDVERTGFTTITPSAKTVQVTQLAERSRARERTLELLETSAVPRRLALPLLGARQRFLTRGRYLEERKRIRARRRRRWETLERIEAELLGDLQELAKSRRAPPGILLPWVSRKKAERTAEAAAGKSA